MNQHWIEHDPDDGQPVTLHDKDVVEVMYGDGDKETGVVASFDFDCRSDHGRIIRYNVVARIKGVPRIPVWTRCDEAMPAHQDHCLVVCAGRIEIASASAKWKGQMLWTGQTGSHVETTHWMDLPPLPKDLT